MVDFPDDTNGEWRLGPDGKFQDAVPAKNIPGSRDGAAAYNMLFDALIQVIRDAGIDPTWPAPEQLSEAIRKLIADAEQEVDLSAFVKNTRKVAAGAGLKGGGDLSRDRTISADIATAEDIAAARVAKMVDASGLVAALPSVTVEVLRSSGVWTAPEGIVGPVYYILTGGGGSGGNTTTHFESGGGGGGGTVIGVLDAVAGESYDYIIGAGGGRTTVSGSGECGGTSRFAGVIAVGGEGGYQTGDIYIGFGGSGGGGSGGLIRLAGGSGGFGLDTAFTSIATIKSGGAGGASFWGGGGRGHRSGLDTAATAVEAQAALDAITPGAGGGGRGQLLGGVAPLYGGAGADGILVMIYSHRRAN